MPDLLDSNITVQASRMTGRLAALLFLRPETTVQTRSSAVIPRIVALIGRVTKTLKSPLASTIARRKLPQQVYHDGDGVPRVHSHPISFESGLDASFNQLRQTASSKPDIVIRLLEALTNIQRCCLTDAQRKAVRKHARLIASDVQRAEMNDSDRKEIMDRMEPFSAADQPSEK